MEETYAEIEARIERIIASIDPDPEVKVSLRRLAAQHDVPVGRLRARLAGVPSKIPMGGNNKKLSDPQEIALCSYLHRLAKVGAHARRPMLQSAANTLLRLTHHHSKRKPPTVGQHWVSRFLARHPEFEIATQKPLAVERHVAEEIEVIQEHFDRFRKIKAEYGIADDDC